MAANPLPSNAGELIQLGNRMLGGLTALGATLGIVQVTPASFGAVLSSYSSDEHSYNTARTLAAAASASYVRADGSLYRWLLQARGVLTVQFGAAWSADWVAAGFVDHSTAVPRLVADRARLAGALKSFFTANPGKEVPSLQVTALKAGQLQDAVVSGKNEVDVKNADARTRKDARETTADVLRKQMRNLITILNSLLTKNDPRWQQFGLNLPGAHTNPARAQDVVAGFAADGTIQASCSAVPLATRYRWRVRVVGVDAEFRRAVSTRDPRAVIDGIDSTGLGVELYVQAVNGAAQGAASEIVMVLPAAQPAAAAMKLSANEGRVAAVIAPAAAALAMAEEERSTAPTEVQPRYQNGNGNGRHLAGI